MNFLLIFLLFLANSYAANIPQDDQVLSTIGQESRNSLPCKELKILVWNLHKGENADFNKDFQSLAKDKDIIITQEMFLSPLMTKIFSDLNEYLFSNATSFLMGRELTRTGVSIATQAPIHNSFYLRTKNVEPITSSPKISLINQYALEGTNEFLTIVDMHAINFVSAEIFEEEMERLHVTLNSLKVLGHPLIIAGDFNTWSLDRTKFFNNFKKQLNLNEAAYKPDYRITFRGFPLDHFLFSKDLKLISAKADKFYQGSDHKPLEVVLSFITE